MKKYKIEILELALEDIKEISLYHLTIVGKQSSQNIMDKIFDKIEQLEDFPLMGSLHNDPLLSSQGYRKLICNEYICVYRLIEEVIYIYRVVHRTTDYPKYFN